MDLYQQKVMDHYRHPRNRGVLKDPDFASDLHNPSCGDSIAVCGRVSLGIIDEVAFTGSGCVISQAAASLLMEASTGKSLGELNSFDAASMVSLLGIELGPTRLKCALLALEALHKGLATYKTP